MRNELPFFCNELTILWNDLPIDWNDLTMEWNDHKLPPCDLVFFFFCHNLFGFFLTLASCLTSLLLQFGTYYTNG